jgi:hypothetical protein
MTEFAPGAGPPAKSIATFLISDMLLFLIEIYVWGAMIQNLYCPAGAGFAHGTAVFT